MTSLKLYVTAKNTDLHCVSAFEAIKHYIGFEPLRVLKRYQLWTLNLETPSHEAAVHCLKQILKDTYYLVNPNKESYTMDALCKEHEGQYFVNVKNNMFYSRIDLAKKIATKCQVPLKGLMYSVVWMLDCKVEGDDSLFKSALTEKVIITTHHHRGLLVNPLFETFEYLSF